MTHTCTLPQEETLRSLHAALKDYRSCARLIADRMSEMGGFTHAQVRALLRARGLTYGGAQVKQSKHTGLLPGRISGRDTDSSSSGG